MKKNQEPYVGYKAQSNKQTKQIHTYRQQNGGKQRERAWEEMKNVKRGQIYT